MMACKAMPLGIYPSEYLGNGSSCTFIARGISHYRSRFDWGLWTGPVVSEATCVLWYPVSILRTQILSVQVSSLKEGKGIYFV